MELKKVVVKEGDIAIITCPFCRKTKKCQLPSTKKLANGNLTLNAAVIRRSASVLNTENIIENLRNFWAGALTCPNTGKSRM
jgi:hypothetical protein